MEKRFFLGERGLKCGGSRNLRVEEQGEERETKTTIEERRPVARSTTTVSLAREGGLKEEDENADFFLTSAGQPWTQSRQKTNTKGITG